MKTKIFGITLLSAFSALALPVGGRIKHREGDTVQLSTGETVKVATYDELEYDSARKPGNTLHFVIFQSSTGTRIAMHSATAGKRVQTAIKSLQGPDVISFDVDYEGQHVPYVVEINGDRALFSVNKDSDSENDRMSSTLGPKVAKTSQEFRQALRELYALMRAGYPSLGVGPASLGVLLNHADLAALPDVDVVSKTALSKTEMHELFEPALK